MLQGELVTLRPMRFDDWEKTIQWRNDINIKYSTMSHPFPITAEQEQEWYKQKLSSINNNEFFFTIELNSNKEAIGYIHLTGIDQISRYAKFGVVIGDKENLGKGFGKDALQLLLSYGFNTLNLNKIYCKVLANHPALTSYLSMGGQKEGYLKKHFYSQGNYEDVIILAWHADL